MRIPLDTVKFDEKGYEGYFVKIPRSVTEGFIYDLQGLRLPTAEGEQKVNRDEVRESNLRLLEQVVEWNFDGSEGSDWPNQVMPLVKDTHDAETRAKIIAEIPVDLLMYLARRVSGRDDEAVPERVKDF